MSLGAEQASSNVLAWKPAFAGLTGGGWWDGVRSSLRLVGFVGRSPLPLTAANGGGCPALSPPTAIMPTRVGIHASRRGATPASGLPSRKPCRWRGYPGCFHVAATRSQQKSGAAGALAETVIPAFAGRVIMAPLRPVRGCSSRGVPRARAGGSCRWRRYRPHAAQGRTLGQTLLI